MVLFMCSFFVRPAWAGLFLIVTPVPPHAVMESLMIMCDGCTEACGDFIIQINFMA